MELSAIGRRLRARRTATGRTVAAVAADAGLSVPYIANLENGRGNPTLAALEQLARALGLRLDVAFEAAGSDDDAGTSVPSGLPGASSPPIPAALVRLGRTERFRRMTAAGAAGLGADPGEFAGRVVAALAATAQALDRDLGEADWWRLLDALLLIAAHPA